MILWWVTALKWLREGLVRVSLMFTLLCTSYLCMPEGHQGLVVESVLTATTGYRFEVQHQRA